jgi:predicted HTH domain antitoxin
MGEVVATRLPEDAVEELKMLAKEEHLERSALVRKMLLKGLEESLLKKAAASYQRGDVSLEEAAIRAKTSIWKMMDYLRANNIHPPLEGLKEMEEGLKRTKSVVSGP